MMQLFDSSVLIAAGASFVAGVIGYIITRFWIKPIVRYTITKRKIRRSLSSYVIVIETQEKTGASLTRRQSGDRFLQQAKKNALILASCYTEEIPYWYRLLLDSRGESPAEASGLLTNLIKIRDMRQVMERVAQAQKKLGL